MADVTTYRSHPDKKLVNHVNGVIEGTKARTALDIAEIAAVFHDVGKLNPNFQQKLKGEKPSGYANHAYLSAFAFLCYCLRNEKQIRDLAGSGARIGSILALIARHHGNLPDFPGILNEEELDRMLNFLEDAPEIPASELVEVWLEHAAFSIQDDGERARQLCQLESVTQLLHDIRDPLDFYLDTQFAFASLIAADKTDAGGYARSEEDVSAFCAQYNATLDAFLDELPQDSELNRKRTAMREEACAALRNLLDAGGDRRVFALTAPTGAGKTLMMLALAGEIIRRRGDFRIIYALPFLSITEQVEDVLKGVDPVFEDLEAHICRIDSKAQRDDVKVLLEKADGGDPEAIKTLLSEQFAEDTFDYPFIVTTFVRLFETLVSNRNAQLLKLPNFSRNIFLIDEIQALPPRLYGFFVAFLNAFCRRFDAYAIVSTATMPNFDLPKENEHDLKDFFPAYESPHELLSRAHFKSSLFNRYTVSSLDSSDGYVSRKEVAKAIRVEDESVLVILSTIDDTKALFELLEDTPDAEVKLLNTHFTPEDRRQKIESCKEILEERQQGRDCDRVILISTQLIEAGVDISFPVLYRDICPVPSIVQSAGRCNRSHEWDTGGVVVFMLKEEGTVRANLIYRGEDGKFLRYAKREVLDGQFAEPDLLNVQRDFFDDLIHKKTRFGIHKGGRYKDGELDFIKRIGEAAFKEVGKFQLIDRKYYGEEYTFYVPAGSDDDSFKRLKKLYEQLRGVPFGKHKRRRIKLQALQEHIRLMGDRMVQVRVSEYDVKTSIPGMTGDVCCNIHLIRSNHYNDTEGIRFAEVALI